MDFLGGRGARHVSADALSQGGRFATFVTLRGGVEKSCQRMLFLVGLGNSRCLLGGVDNCDIQRT